MSSVVELNGVSSFLDGKGYFVVVRGPHLIAKLDHSTSPELLQELPYSKALLDAGGYVETVSKPEMSQEEIYKELEAASKYKIATVLAFGIHRIILGDDIEPSKYAREIKGMFINGEIDDQFAEKYISYVTSVIDVLFGSSLSEEGQLTMRGALALSILCLKDNLFPGSSVREKAKKILGDDPRARYIYNANDMFRVASGSRDKMLPYLSQV